MKSNPEPKRYEGPAKPIPTHRELMSDKAERIIFLIRAVVFAVMLLTGVV
jgi:hypothetical protein